MSDSGWTEATSRKKKQKKRKEKRELDRDAETNNVEQTGVDLDLLSSGTPSIEEFRQKLLRQDAERAAREAAQQEAREKAEKETAARKKKERHERRKKAGLEKTRRHNAAKKLEAEKRRRQQLGLPSPGETESSSSDSESENTFFDATNHKSDRGNSVPKSRYEEIADSSDEEERYRSTGGNEADEQDEGCCCGWCCCSSLDSCAADCLTCGGECDIRDCRTCCDENCCNCCTGLLKFLYYSSCACCLLPTARAARRSWPLLVLISIALCAWVGVTLQEDDVSSMSIKLENGNTMPLVALGTWQIPSGWRLARTVRVAIEEGYRHIDAAAVYGNEKSLGAALQRELLSGAITRDELFITSKLWNSDHDPNRVELACRRTLKELQLEYLDLYLMHWPTAFQGGDEKFPRHPETGQMMYGNPILEDGIDTGKVSKPVHFVETYEAMERLVRKGLVRSIGISNFNESQIADILQMATFLPQVLQIENHPYLPQSGLVDFAKEKGIVVQAYSPLGSPGRPAGWDAGRYDVPPNLIDHEGIAILRDIYGKTPAQILIKYQLQRGNAVVVKSSTPARIQSNADLFSWKISEFDMSRLGRMGNVDWRYCQPQEYNKTSKSWYIRDLAHPHFPFADEVALKKEEEEERKNVMAKYAREQEEKRKRGEEPLDPGGNIGLTQEIKDEMEKFQRRVFSSFDDEPDISQSKEL